MPGLRGEDSRCRGVGNGEVVDDRSSAHTLFLGAGCGAILRPILLPEVSFPPMPIRGAYRLSWQWSGHVGGYPPEREKDCMGRQIQLTAVIEREDDGYVSLCPELDIASQGDSIEEARKNLVEALELFFETADQEEIQSRIHAEVYVTRIEVAVG